MPSADLPPHAATPAGLELRLLGPLEVRNGTKVVTVGGPRVRALLGVLLLEANRVVDLDRLVDALWEGSPPASTRQSLHFLVHKLRRSLAEVPGGGDLLVTRGSGYLLNVPPGALDAARFESGLAAARAAMAAGDHEAASHGFAAALALWRGQPLGGLSGHVFDVARTRLEELRIGARIDRVDAELELGRHADVLDELRALVAEQPLRERPQAQLMLALYRSGRQAEALDVARVARTAFVEDLGIEPGPELQRLEEAVRTRAAWLDAPAPPAAPPAAPAPDRRELELGEERKVVTVLVVTLRPGGGPDAVDPEDARTRLATGLEEVDRQVRRFGGVVQAVVGGTAVAAFGVPLAHEDDPERAVRAALELCDPDRAAFEVQAGVETGEALVTAPADDGRHHGVVVGAVVDKAAALAATAPPGAVAVGPAVESATRRVMDYRQEGAGWLAAGPRSRTGAAERTPTASPLIEREQELAVLRGLLGRVRWGREAQLLTLVGDPGVGKSRLIDELGRLVEADPELVAWRQGRSLPYGEGVAFWALGEVVKAEAGILDSDDADVAEAKLSRAVADVVADPADAAWIAGHLAPLVRAAVPAETGTDREEAFAAWRRFLEALAAVRPLVLVLEDLQWADDDLLSFVDDLVERAGPVPLLVACAARPELLERRPDWGGGKRNATTLSVAPLTPDGTAELLGALLGEAELPEAARTAVVAAAGGNPLFVEEYVRVLRDQAGPGAGVPPVPDSVQQVLTARLDTLDPADKALLRDAAVLGEVAWVGALAEVSGTGRAAVEDWLYRLERRELVRRARWSSVGGEVQFAFRHVLMRDVAYGQLTRGQRADRHRLAAGWIETLAADRAADRAELLAHHYSSALELLRSAGREPGELAGKARLALREAGDRARLLRAWPTAARRYAAALELWPAGDPARPELLLRLGEARFNGEQQGAPELEEASAALLAAGNRDAAAHAETLLAFIAFFRGDGEGRNRHGLRAFELVRDQPPSSAKAAVLTRMASNLMMTDQVPQSLGLASQALAVARAVDDPELAYTLTVNGLARTRAGDPGGIEDLEAAALLAESQRSSHSEYFWVQVVTGYGWIADLGPRAAAAMARSEQAAERFGSVPGRRINVDSVRAMYFYVVGDWPAAAASAERVIAFPLPFFMKTPSRLARGRIRLGAGDVEGAAEDARVALEIARVSGHSGLLQPALSFSAFMAMSAGRTEEAAELTAELADGLSIGFVHCDSGVDMGLALARFGYGPELFDAEGMVRTGFTRGVRAVVAGEYAAAAEIYGGFGARADEARCRVLDAERLLAEGREAEAADQLVAAAAFYDDAGATAHRDAVDRLLVRAGAADPIG